jgi:hypothetical protein
VLHRRGRPGVVEVVGADRGEAHVREEAQRPQRVPQGLPGPLTGEQQVGRDVRDRQHEDRSGHEAPYAPGVEVAQADPAAARVLAQQQPGDEEAGEDEEDVHADVAAGGGTEHVAGDHQQDRDRAQALHVRTERAAGGGHVALGAAGTGRRCVPAMPAVPPARPARGPRTTVRRRGPRSPRRRVG